MTEQGLFAERFRPSFELGEATVGRGWPVFVIAEAGVNHNGRVDLAIELVRQAKRAGADSVKFQTFKADRIALPDAPKAGYQTSSTSGAETQREMLRALELTESEHREIIATCDEEGILFLSTPYGPEDADVLDELGVPAFKIASAQIVEPSFLAHVASKGKPVILSSGMATLDEVEEGLRALAEGGCSEVGLLQCHTEYPSDARDANVAAMARMGDILGVPVGFSDHTTSSTAAIVAVALGASIIEKHLTLDRSLPGPDHAASSDPTQFRAYVEAIREAESAIGDPVKKPTAREQRNLVPMRRSVVANVDIEAGVAIERSMLGLKRPGNGLPPHLLDELVGRRSTRRIHKDTQIRKEDVKW